MTGSKNLYAVLGVLPTAEDIVIRSAYRALAQRYHPDRYSGPKAEAEIRMRELNEAFAVLSDPLKRSQYDERLSGEGNRGYEAEAEFSGAASLDEAIASRDGDWAIACRFYADLVSLHARLRQINLTLASMFKAYMLESQDYLRRHEVAERMESLFLQRYFGSDPTIIAFAKQLISSGNRDAARALNQCVRVMGSGVHPAAMIDAVRSDFNISRKEEIRSIDVLEFLAFVRRGNRPEVERLLQNAAALLSGADSDGQTALHIALIERHLELVHFLLKRGADPDVKNAFGKTPRDYARENGLQID